METLTIGKYTFAHVDLPNDAWAWAIVKDYVDCQTYGKVLMAFLPGEEPEEKTVTGLLEFLNNSVE